MFSLFCSAVFYSVMVISFAGCLYGLCRYFFNVINIISIEPFKRWRKGVALFKAIAKAEIAAVRRYSQEYREMFQDYQARPPYPGIAVDTPMCRRDDTGDPAVQGSFSVLSYAVLWALRDPRQERFEMIALLAKEQWYLAQENEEDTSVVDQCYSAARQLGLLSQLEGIWSSIGLSMPEFCALGHSISSPAMLSLFKSCTERECACVASVVFSSAATSSVSAAKSSGMF